MQAVLLAGGKGTRLHPLTTRVPKPMVPLFDRPVLEHTIGLLRKHGVSHIIITLSYRATDIINYFGGGSRLGVHIQYAIEDVPLGTAGGLHGMKPALKDTFLVMSGDGVTDFDLTAAIEEHHRHAAEASMLLYQIPDPVAICDFGVVETNEQGRISRFVEKPGLGQTFSDTVNTGIYILEPSVIDRIPEDRPFDFSRDLFPTLLREGAPFYGHRAAGYWCDIGNLNQYRQVHQDALNGHIKLEMKAQQIERGIWVARGAELDPSVRLNGPCFIGSDARVHAGAVLADGAVLGHGSVMESDSRVTASVIGANSVIGRNAGMENCILGEGYHVTNGRKVRNSVLTSDVEPMDICAVTGRAISSKSMPAVIAA